MVKPRSSKTSRSSSRFRESTTHVLDPDSNSDGNSRRSSQWWTHIPDQSPVDKSVFDSTNSDSLQVQDNNSACKYNDDSALITINRQSLSPVNDRMSGRRQSPKPTPTLLNLSGMSDSKNNKKVTLFKGIKKSQKHRFSVAFHSVNEEQEGKANQAHNQNKLTNEIVPENNAIAVITGSNETVIKHDTSKHAVRKTLFREKTRKNRGFSEAFHSVTSDERTQGNEPNDVENDTSSVLQNITSTSPASSNKPAKKRKTNTNTDHSQTGSVNTEINKSKHVKKKLFIDKQKNRRKFSEAFSTTKQSKIQEQLTVESQKSFGSENVTNIDNGHLAQDTNTEMVNDKSTSLSSFSTLSSISESSQAQNWKKHLFTPHLHKQTSKLESLELTETNFLKNSLISSTRINMEDDTPLQVRKRETKNRFKPRPSIPEQVHPQGNDTSKSKSRGNANELTDSSTQNWIKQNENNSYMDLGKSNAHRKTSSKKGEKAINKSGTLRLSTDIALQVDDGNLQSNLIGQSSLKVTDGSSVKSNTVQNEDNINIELDTEELQMKTGNKSIQATLTSNRTLHSMPDIELSANNRHEKTFNSDLENESTRSTIEINERTSYEESNDVRDRRTRKIREVRVLEANQHINEPNVVVTNDHIKQTNVHTAREKRKRILSTSMKEINEQTLHTHHHISNETLQNTDIHHLESANNTSTKVNALLRKDEDEQVKEQEFFNPKRKSKGQTKTSFTEIHETESLSNLHRNTESEGVSGVVQPNNSSYRKKSRQAENISHSHVIPLANRENNTSHYESGKEKHSFGSVDHGPQLRDSRRTSEDVRRHLNQPASSSTTKLKQMTDYFQKTSKPLKAARPVQKPAPTRAPAAHRPKAVKLFDGKKRWANAKFYSVLQKQLKDKYGETHILESENLMKIIVEYVDDVVNSKKHEPAKIRRLEQELARRGVIEDTIDFYQMIGKYLPYSFRDKVIPCAVAFSSEPTVPPTGTGSMFQKIQF